VGVHAAPRNAAHAAAFCDAAERLYRDADNRFNDRYHWVCNNCESFCVSYYEAPYRLGEDAA
jgi:hypothetical protein